jgi:hypothetical protein
MSGLMEEFLGREDVPGINFHGLKTVADSHFGPATDQALCLMTMGEDIPGSLISSMCQSLLGEMEEAHRERHPALDI